MNCLASLKDSFHFELWSTLLDDRCWSVDVGDNFTIGVVNGCLEGIYNLITTSMDRIIFLFSCVRCFFILLSIEVKLAAILAFILRWLQAWNSFSLNYLYWPFINIEDRSYDTNLIWLGRRKDFLQPVLLKYLKRKNNRRIAKVRFKSLFFHRLIIHNIN